LKETFSELLKVKSSRELMLNVISFGYKYGLPVDADLVFDVRFLPNPAYVERLKNFTGNNKRVKKFVKRAKATKIFLKKIFSLLDFLLPNYIKEGKSYLTIAIGCTGGRHRSVVVVNEIKQYFQNRNYIIRVKHRDIDK